MLKFLDYNSEGKNRVAEYACVSVTSIKLLLQLY